MAWTDRTTHEVDPSWVERITSAAPTVGPVRLVCVDGPAGAGKSTVAALLAAALATECGAVPVVHGDEVYEGWAVVATEADRPRAFGALGARLETWLLDPWSRDEAGSHPVWDWESRAWGGTREVPAAPVVVLEGVGLASRSLRARAVLSVWVDADVSVRLRRVLARDGEAVRAEMATWQVDEDSWHRSDRTREDCDVRLRTG
jgi:uridine kinase